jgi:hypothetical protein
MRHIKNYKLFESLSKYPTEMGDYIDESEIHDRLEFEIGDPVWVNVVRWVNNKDVKIPGEVMDIKVGIDVAGSPHNEIWVYYYYVRNSETEDIESFRSFKLDAIEN